jgi:hypothetical protein
MGNLSKGHIIGCSDRNRRGGLKAIYLGEVAGVSSATAAAPHSYSGIGGFTTGQTVALMYKFEFERETAYYTANATRENGSTIVETELGFSVPKVTEEIQARLEELKNRCGLFAIVETFADDGLASPTTYKFVLGYDEIFSPESFLEFASGEQNSGTGLQDANETVVKLTGFMGEYPREYTGTITLETAADNSFILS